MGLRERLEGSCTVPAPVLDARPKSAPVIADTEVGDLNASDVPEKRRVMLPANISVFTVATSQQSLEVSRTCPSP